MNVFFDTNIYYIVRRLRSVKAALKTLILLRDVFAAVACDTEVLDQAIDSDFADFGCSWPSSGPWE